jgi:hypothetical protein
MLFEPAFQLQSRVEQLLLIDPRVLHPCVAVKRSGVDFNGLGADKAEIFVEDVSVGKPFFASIQDQGKQCVDAFFRLVISVLIAQCRKMVLEWNCTLLQKEPRAVQIDLVPDPIPIV